MSRDWVGLGRGFFWGFSLGRSMGLFFLLGPGVFSSFISCLLCYWGLRSSEPWGCLWFPILLFLLFFFVDIGTFLKTEHDIALLHMDTYIAKKVAQGSWTLYVLG